MSATTAGTKDRLAAGLQLRGAPRAVFDALVLHAARDAAAWPSVSTLARETGYCARSVQRALRALEGEGLVRGRRRLGRSTVWSVAPNARRGDLARACQRPTARRAPPATSSGRDARVSAGGRGSGGPCSPGGPASSSRPTSPPVKFLGGDMGVTQNRTPRTTTPEDARATTPARPGVSRPSGGGAGGICGSQDALHRDHARRGDEDGVRHPSAHLAGVGRPGPKRVECARGVAGGALQGDQLPCRPPPQARHLPQVPPRRQIQGLAAVTTALLRAPGRLLQALRRWRRLSTADELRALAAARTALRDGRNPAALFSHLYQRGGGITIEDDDAARLQWLDLQGRAPGPRKDPGRRRVSPGCTVNVKSPPAVSLAAVLEEMR